MNYKLLFLLIYIILSVNSVFAQTYEDIIENQSEENGEDMDYSDMHEQFQYYMSQPLNINKADKKQLQTLPLSDIQINALLDHIAANGELIDVLELQSIDFFDVPTIKNIFPYIRIKPSVSYKINFNTLRKNGDQELVIRYQQVLQKQKGYINDTYVGSPGKILTKYRYSLPGKLNFGFSGEKDAGEEFLKGSQRKGFDFNSAYLFIKNAGRIKSLAVGNYRVETGQGLAIGSGLLSGKGSDITSIQKRAQTLMPYTSANEYGYLRGIAAQFEWKHWDVMSFASFKKIDGLIEGSDIISLSETGYHRTQSEIEKKKRIEERTIGTTIQYSTRKFSMGISGYNKALKPLADQTSKTVWSVDYSYGFNNMVLFGESSYSGNKGYAFMQGALMIIDPKVSLSLLYRNYSGSYNSSLGLGFSESSSTANETGFYTGIKIQPTYKSEWNTYIDVFRFSYLRYLIDAPSNGLDILSQYSTSISKLKITGRVKYKLKDKNLPDNETAFNRIEHTHQWNYRYHMEYKITENITLKHRIEYNTYQQETLKKEEGFMIYNDISYNAIESRVSVQMRFILFNTGTHTKIYSYENDLPGSFSSPSVQDEGSRFYINGKYKVNRHIELSWKYGVNTYFNKELIGSGNDEIKGNKKSELKLQMKMKL